MIEGLFPFFRLKMNWEKRIDLEKKCDLHTTLQIP
jgi:hypothetical protein